MRLSKCDGTLPVEVGDKVEHQEVVFGQDRLLDLDRHTLHDKLPLILTHDARLNGGICINGDIVAVGAKQEVGIVALQEAVETRHQTTHHTVVLLALLLSDNLALLQEHHLATVDSQGHSLVAIEQADSIFKVEARCRELIVVVPVVAHRSVILHKALRGEHSIVDVVRCGILVIEAHNAGIGLLARGYRLLQYGVYLLHSALSIGQRLRYVGICADQALSLALGITIANLVNLEILDTPLLRAQTTGTLCIQDIDNIGDNGPVVHKAILLRGDSEGHSIGIVGCNLHLVDIPLATQIR